MNDIELLQEEIKRLEAQIQPLKERIFECQNSIAEISSQFKIGDVVTWNAGKSKRLGRVETIIFNSRNPDNPKWIVRIIRKDGTDGSAVTIRGYDKPELASCTTP